ncbi:sulfate adenylyltransferase [Marinomonas sp. M1K-6]|uniref:Sulfate adenylyltransferase n=1 Tax=Marinomonas profundi TaxID=2726122 RepID=A0A847QZ79_9GAMM|nr:transglutaminase-like cysteine peptidase [Marinomonas profundi]NLQ16115.1 sulfate adenylyltransferase [Marinomonas profundi]UDV03299.1 transglutaminase-like cysteine peptidase [Marinomonas profundi]
MLCIPHWWLYADVSDKYRTLAKQAGSTYGSDAEKRILAWRQLIEESKALPIVEQLAQVNNFFNQMDFVDDVDLWGKEDYWATPIEFLGMRAGDCEDFTIAKYFTLRELGVPDEKLRLVYVKALSLDQHHMVLAYYHKPTSVPVLLDNLDKELKPASKRNDLLPIYSFNAENLWLTKEKGRGVLVGGSSRLSLWTDLNNRLNTITN